MPLWIYKQSKILPNQKLFFQIAHGVCSGKYNKHSYQKCDQFPQPHFKLCVKLQEQELFFSYHLPIFSPIHTVTAILFCSGHHMLKESNKTPFFVFLFAHSKHTVSFLWFFSGGKLIKRCGFLLSVESKSFAPFSLVQDFTLAITGKY